jgi:hypothetical protein
VFLSLCFVSYSFFKFCICSLPSPLLLFVVLCHSTTYSATIWHCKLFLALRYYCLVWCVTLALHSCYLLWCIIFCVALIVVVHCLCLALSLLLVVVHCPSLCTIIFMVFHLSPYANVVCCDVLSLTLCCYYFLWCVVPHFTLLFIVVHHPCLALLLFFIMVFCPLPCPVIACCDASPLYYVVLLKMIVTDLINV